MAYSLDLPNICPRHVLYTDSDVMFTNKITHKDMDMLKSLIPPSGKPYVLYGHEHVISHKPQNTGIVLMDIPKFEKAWPEFLQFRRDVKGGVPSFDQGWFNLYHSKNKTYQERRALLPVYWNWKVYWKLEPSSFSDLKIVHFHGPKPGIGVGSLALCDTNMTGVPAPYRYFVTQESAGTRGRRPTEFGRFVKHLLYTSSEPNLLDFS